jgi:hypothetical protein
MRWPAGPSWCSTQRKTAKNTAQLCRDSGKTSAAEHLEFGAGSHVRELDFGDTPDPTHRHTILQQRNHVLVWGHRAIEADYSVSTRYANRDFEFKTIYAPGEVQSSWNVDTVMLPCDVQIRILAN